MPLEKAEQIALFFSPCEYTRGHVLLEPNVVADEYIFVKNGLVRSYTIDINNEEVTTGFFGERQIAVNLHSFFKRVPSKETFYCLSDLQGYSITFAKVQEAFHGLPEFREFGRMMLINAYSRLKEEMLAGLHKTAEQRYIELLQTNPHLFMHAALKDVASYLGITDSSLSRIRKEFVKK